MSGSGREVLPNVREWSGGPPRCPGVVERSSWMFGSDGRACRMSRSGQEALGVSGNGREALPDVREWSGGPRGCPGVVGRPSWKSGSGREAIGDVQE